MYTAVQYSTSLRNIISSPATFAYFIGIFKRTSVPPQLATHDVKEIHAAYRRAYVLSLLTWPGTCTHPRHAHRGSEALSLSRASCWSTPRQYHRIREVLPHPQLIRIMIPENVQIWNKHNILRFLIPILTYLKKKVFCSIKKKALPPFRPQYSTLI